MNNMPVAADSSATTTVEEALSLIRETRAAMGRADAALERLGRGKPAILSELVAPTLRIRERLQADLVELERLSSQL